MFGHDEMINNKPNIDLGHLPLLLKLMVLAYNQRWFQQNRARTGPYRHEFRTIVECRYNTVEYIKVLYK